MKSPAQRYNQRNAKHEVIEDLARQLYGNDDFRQSLRRCRSAAKQMLQGKPALGLVEKIRQLFAEARA